MRSYATPGMDVGEVLGRVNRAIIGDLEPERYLTMLLVGLDVKAATMAYANAGHIPGVLLDCPDGMECIMGSTGFLSGSFPTRHFRPVTVSSGRDRFWCSADGASETSDADGTEFGRDRVIEYVPRHASDTAHEIATGVYRAARSFGASEAQHDDITAVIVKVTAAALCVDKTSLPLETVAV
jgi:phosphoserine phosphatase RsbU/P